MQVSHLRVLLTAGLIFVTSLSVGQVAAAQANATKEWSWMSGSSTIDQQGVYGSLGTPAAASVPGNRSSAVSWTDNNGNLWLFGGYEINSSSVYGYLNDLWEFNPSTNEWVWMGGGDAAGQPGVYGTLGTGAVGNIPGSRASATSWTDSSGNLWMFGGMGEDANGTWGWLNDLWEYQPSINEWAWMGGSSTVGSGCDQSGDCGRPGVYGTLGTPAVGNIPGGRYGANSWIDSSGHIWLFGGNGFDASGNWGLLNDLWVFSPSTNEWTWMNGSSTVGTSTGPVNAQPGVYGTLGTSAPGNVPGGRRGASSWIDKQGSLWLLEGEGTDASGDYANQNDLWKYNPSTKEWAWMGGNSFGDAYGVYGTLGMAAAGNFPGSRSNATSWTDSTGNFWLFGGTGLLSSASSYGGRLNDLWEYNISTGEWAWMGGSNVFPSNCAVPGSCGLPGVYGTLGDPAAGNIPGSRFEANGWIDDSGNFWLFGGLGYDIAGNDGYLNDMWRYQLSTVNQSAATPTFSVPAGTYTSSQSVTISDTTPDATIYYTTIGTPPTTSSTVYSGPITISSSETLEAIAIANGYSTSAVASAAYTISPVVSGPGIQSVSAILPEQTQTITITGLGFGTHAPYNGDSALISITDPNATPWEAGYANASQGIDDLITLSITSWTDTQIVLAGFTGSYGANGWTLGQSDKLSLSIWNAQTGTGPYNCTNIIVGAGPTTCAAIPIVATPTFSVPGGSYTSAQMVTITDTTPSATIYYTTNGTTPTTSASVYNGPITVSSSETLEAIAIASGYSTSTVATAAYVINLPQVATPTFSPAAGTYSSAQRVEISDATSGATIYYTTNGTAPTTGSSVYTGAVIVSSTETLEAIATATGYLQSAVASASYTITPGFAVSGTAVTVSPGATTGNTSTITVTPSGGFTGSVTLTASITSSPSGAQDPPTVSFGSTTPVSITSTGAGTAVLTITTTAATTVALADPKHRTVPWYAAGGATLACMLLFGIPAKRRWRTMIGMLALLVALTGGILACGGGGGTGGGGGASTPGTTAGTYTITVTAQSGAMAETGNVSLTVQ